MSVAVGIIWRERCFGRDTVRMVMGGFLTLHIGRRERVAELGR
jgi:hypothetical protein